MGLTGTVASGEFLRGHGRPVPRDNKMEFSIKEKFETAKQFLREAKTELKKVTWPSRKDTLSGTVVVLVAVFVIAIFLGIVDAALSNLIKELLRKAAS